MENIRSKYILKQIFSKININICLNVIKYNKNLQQKLDIDINVYKDYTQIEIEVIPIKNIEGTFRLSIYNISKKKHKYCHTYFNNSNEEIKRDYFTHNDIINKINIIFDGPIYSFHELFRGCYYFESINFIKFNRTNIIDMHKMFSGCLNLKEINLSNFKTDSVTNMQNMFAGCKSLVELNLSSFNTKNVTNMKNMFSWCSSLKKIDLSSFNTNNVTDMTKMFNACLSLKNLNLSNFNTYNVTNMKLMFKFCCSLKEIKFSSNFKTDNVTNMKYMFSHCSSLQDLRISHFNFNNVINMRCIFQYCSWELKEKLEDQIGDFEIIKYFKLRTCIY